MMTTIKDIAKVAGVSLSTVSRALSGHPKISAETKARVREIAKQLDYRPFAGFAALGIRASRRKAKHSLIPIAYVQIVRGDWRIVEERGWEELQPEYNLRGFEVRSVDLSKLGRNPPEALYAQGFAGIIFNEFGWDDEALHFDWQRFVVTCLRRQGKGAPFMSVKFDYAQGAREAWLRIAHAGYKRIGLAPRSHMPDKSNYMLDDIERLEGLLSTHCIHRGALPEIPPLLTQIGDQASLTQWYRQYEPDAVIGFNSLTLYQLQSAGAEIPNNLGFAALALNENNPTSCSGMMSSTRALAKVAAETTAHQFKHGIFGQTPDAYEVSIPMSWCDAGTL